MTKMKAISVAMKLIDVKKENLRKAFEDLQTHSSSLSSFTLTWSDLDSHFTSLQSSVQHQFKLLQTLESQSPTSKPPPIPSSSAIAVKSSTNLVPARPELKSLCEKMDGLGLRKYIIDRPKERTAIRVELPDAMWSAPDAAAMVLDAMEGFSSNDDLDLRRTCVILLEELMGLKMEIKGEVRERAMKLAVECKGKMTSVKNNANNTLEVLGFLQLVATYGLVNGFSMDELIDYAVIVAKNRVTIHLCRALNFGDKMSDLIQKLISNGKQLLAVKFIFEFEKTDKFRPVPLLKAYAKESKDLVRKIRESGNQHSPAMKEAATKELNDLKSVIKCIEDYKLESEYPKNILLNCIEKLEKEKSDRKRAAAAPASMPQQQSKPQKESRIKLSQTSAPADPATILRSDAANLTMPESVACSAAISLYQQPPLQTAGLLPDHTAPYLSSPVVPYGMAGSNPAIAPYTGSSAGLYELSGAPMSFSGDVPVVGVNSYPSGSYMSSGYFDGQIAYGGYGLPPQYHPAYYPQ